MKTIKAIAYKDGSKSVHPDLYQVLGAGETESDARISAYAATHHGHNDFDSEYQGGEVFDIDADVIELWEQGFSCGVILKNGVLVQEPRAHTEYKLVDGDGNFLNHICLVGTYSSKEDARAKLEEWADDLFSTSEDDYFLAIIGGETVETYIKECTH